MLWNLSKPSVAKQSHSDTQTTFFFAIPNPKRVLFTSLTHPNIMMTGLGEERTSVSCECLGVTLSLPVDPGQPYCKSLSS